MLPQDQTKDLLQREFETLEKLHRLDLLEFEKIKKTFDEKARGYSKRQEEIKMEIKIMEADDFDLKYTFADWSEVVVKSIKYLSDDKLKYLIFKRSGIIDHTSTHDYWYSYGECTTYKHARSKQETRESMLRYLREKSCRYCKSVFHSKENCQKLLSLVCDACHVQGHDVSHCKMQVRDLYKHRK